MNIEEEILEIKLRMDRQEQKSMRILEKITALEKKLVELVEETSILRCFIDKIEEDVLNL